MSGARDQETEDGAGRLSPDPRFRTLLVLGDSIVAGWGVESGESYPALLERLLNREITETASASVPSAFPWCFPFPAWRVINAGVPGDTAVMGCLRYARDVRPFRPQGVLIAFGLNDAALRHTHVDAQRERLWRAQHQVGIRLIVACERLVAKVRRRIARRGVPWYAPADGISHEARPRVAPEVFCAALRKLVRSVRRDGAQAYLLSLSPVADAWLSAAQGERYRQYNTLIAQVARECGAPLLDLGATGDEPFVETMWMEDGVHLTQAGQAYLARRVYAQLKRQRLGIGDQGTERQPCSLIPDP